MASVTVFNILLLCLMTSPLALAVPERLTYGTWARTKTTLTTISSRPSSSSTSSSTLSSTPLGFQSFTTATSTVTYNKPTTVSVTETVVSINTFTAGILPFTEATEVSTPPAPTSTAAAPTSKRVAPLGGAQGSSCRWGVKICEPSARVTCNEKNGHCQACVDEPHGVGEICKWFVGSAENDWNGHGCNDPEYWCAEFWNAGYDTELDLQCSILPWFDYYGPKGKTEINCDPKWNPYCNEKPPDIPEGDRGNMEEGDFSEWGSCDIEPYEGPPLGRGLHPAPSQPGRLF
ncbi:MAG: hypothetical protein Q9166_003513 [cf. Caloplaca sp. 2 TL-2023]